MASFEDLIARALDSASRIANTDLATQTKKYDLQKWKNWQITKVTTVGFVTGFPGGCLGWLLAPLDLAYLFGVAAWGCYGVGHLLGREIDRETDIRLIMAIWCGSAEAVAGVTAGKLAIKIVGKAALPTMAGFAVKVFAKTAVKGGGKMMTKIMPQIVAKVAGQFAGKAGATLIPILGGVVSAGISYWVASSMLNAAESYYRHEYVQFTDGNLTPAELGVEVGANIVMGSTDG